MATADRSGTEHEDRRRLGGSDRVRFPWWTVSAIAALGFLLVVLATRWGAGITPDSVVYVTAARHWVAGGGIALPAAGGDSEPVIHCAPLFILLLGAPAKLGLDPLDIARWLNAGCFALAIVLLGRAAWRQAAGSRRVAVAACGLLAFAFEAILAHSFAWSEPAFLVLTIVTLDLLSVPNPSRGRVIVAAAAAGLAFATRYVGVPLVGAGALALLLGPGRDLARRLADGALFALIGSAPVALWFARNLTVAGSAADRSLVLHFPEAAVLARAAGLLVAWSGPAIVVLAVLWWTGRRSGDRWPRPAWRGRLRPWLVFAPLYVGFVLLSISLFDAHTPTNARIFLPVYAALTVVFLTWIDSAVRGVARAGRARRVLLVALVVLSLIRVPTAVAWTARSFDRGLGYTARAWRESETIAAVRELPETIELYSNGDDAIRILTGRDALRLPRTTDPTRRRENPRLSEELDRIARRLAAREAVIVWLDRVNWRWYLPDADELAERLALETVAEFDDGRFFTVPTGKDAAPNS